MDVSNLPVYRNDGLAYRIKEVQTRTVLLPNSMMSCGVLYFSINFRMESQYFTYCPTASFTDL